MADVHHADASGEIDIAIAIDIFYHSPFGLGSKYWYGSAYTTRHKPLAARQ
jgi:hypothetical protein